MIAKNLSLFFINKKLHSNYLIPETNNSPKNLEDSKFQYLQNLPKPANPYPL